MAVAVEMSLVLRIFISILVLHLVTAQDDQSDFISIDCGSPENYTEDENRINYVSDDGFIESGVKIDISSIHNYTLRVLKTLRSFSENKQNCYTLRPKKGKNNTYLIRATFFYDDTRGQAPQFDLYIGADYWATIYISDPAKYVSHEMIHFTSSDYINVCLVNTDQGHPFISSLELRPLDNTMYEDQSPSSLFLVDRFNFGANEKVRYPDDKYDRIWDTFTTDCCREIQTSDTVSLGPYNIEQVPSKVMSTAVTPINSTNDQLQYSWDAETTDEFIIYIHLADVTTFGKMREFDIDVNGTFIGTFSSSTDVTTFEKEIRGSPSMYTLNLTSTDYSSLPPILNALEIYSLHQLLQNQTDDQDAAAIWSTKSTYELTKSNWQGDPCVPQEYVWVGLNCVYSDPRAARIISLNLSSKGLNGEIAPALANLTNIESLDLSYNNLIGNVPEFLARLDNLQILNLKGNNFTGPLPAELLEKSNEGSLQLKFDPYSSPMNSFGPSGESSNDKPMNDVSRKNKPNIVVILASIVGVVVVSSLVVLSVKQLKKKGLQLNNLNAAFSRRLEGLTPRKQQFTYSEVVGITKNFQNEIGRGGFGRVFRGSVGGKEVAVKMLSESSSQGYKEFQAEVKLLMEIHHTNITSLVGYCDDNKHKGIIYEFMANGNLQDHLFEGCPDILSWERRLQIGCDAAEGLAYMHHGCKQPIVHRDVKSSNILLNESFQAKVSDFGLSRAYPTEDASHVSSQKVVGTAGYIDPEYQSTNRLTEKSDVYSFGVVLLELITGRRATSNGIHIVDWAKSSIEEGNVETILDARLLEGRFYINTAWTVVETAITCVSPTSVTRPTMNDVVMDLKHCLQAEKTRQTGSASLNLDLVSDPNPR